MRAGRQYDAVDPENRIVASELERRWNERLGEVARLEGEVQSAREVHANAGISESERAALMALADDLPHAWNHPAATATTRKRILRAVLEEVMVRSEGGRLHLKLHWKGGEHINLPIIIAISAEVCYSA